jgi:hypothetical protein
MSSFATPPSAVPTKPAQAPAAKAIDRKRPKPSQQRYRRKKYTRGEHVATFARPDGGELRVLVVSNPKGPAVSLRSWGKGEDGELFPYGWGVSVVPREVRAVGQTLLDLADRMEGEVA